MVGGTQWCICYWCFATRCFATRCCQWHMHMAAKMESSHAVKPKVSAYTVAQVQKHVKQDDWAQVKDTALWACSSTRFVPMVCPEQIAHPMHLHGVMNCVHLGLLLLVTEMLSGGLPQSMSRNTRIMRAAHLEPLLL
eukprot:jgi/Ulvmu1/2147/UM129_0006.1